MIVCMPPTVRLLPLSTVQVCGAPMVTGTLKPRFIGGDAADGDRQRAVVDAVEHVARRPGDDRQAVGDDRAVRLMLPPTVLKVAAVSLFSQAYVGSELPY